MDNTTNAILRQVASLGYKISVFPRDGFTDIMAWMHEGELKVIARSLDGNSDDDIYRAACALAECVGIDLMHG